MIELGLKRRQEYVHNTHFLSHEIDIHEVLLMSTDFNRTEESLRYFLYGLYPMEEH